MEFDQARGYATADDEVVEGGLLNRPATATGARLDERAVFKFELPVPDLLEGAGQISGGNRREKTQPADVDAEQRRLRAGDFPRGAEQGAVAAEDQQQIHRARQRGGVRTDISPQAGGLGGGGVAINLPARRADQPGGLGHGLGAGGLAGVADQPDALDFVSDFFQSTPKILCCPPGRAGGIP